MIDAPATQNRAMEWQAWRQRVDGELYYDTTYAFTRGDAWSSQYYFGGNGDGTLFYPGTPAKIGGTTQIPIASLRLKMIREGMEDYEYFKALADAGDAAMADREAAALSPTAYQSTADPAQIDAARHRIALRIEALTGQTPPPMGGPGAGAGGAERRRRQRRRQRRQRRPYRPGQWHARGERERRQPRRLLARRGAAAGRCAVAARPGRAHARGARGPSPAGRRRALLPSLTVARRPSSW